MTRPFVPWPAAVLRSPARPVGEVTDEHRALWDEMIAVMDAMPGVGLAAPQLGVPLALAVVDASDERGRAIRLADPKILRAWPEIRRGTEGSPNLPNVWAEIDRPARVEVAYTDETGARVSKGFEGLWSASVQHQIDHLEGRMFFDRLSRTKRAMLLKKARRR